MATNTTKDTFTTNQKEIIRDEIFSRFDKPLGIDQYKWNTLGFSIDMLGSAYMFYLFFTFQHPWSQPFLFGKIEYKCIHK